MAMNTKRYDSLPTDLKKVIDNNSGVATSGWLGKTQQGNDPAGRKSATDRGNSVFTIPATDAQEFKRKATLVEAEWIADMDQRGMNGRQLRDTARALIEKYGSPGAVSKTGKSAKSGKT
jgi:TRAP-type C4-dicarboxylate transport system substrate-binding protein